MNEARWIYLAQLTMALQNEGVEGRRAGEFVAEIDSHLAEDGSDPVTEFGTPQQLAAGLARRPGSIRTEWVPPIWWMWVIGLIGAVIGGAAVDALVQGSIDGAIPVRARGVVWVGALCVGIIGLRYSTARRLDGRSWSSLGGGRVVLAALGVGAVASLLVQWVGDRELFRVTTGVFWAAVVTVALLVIGLGGRYNNPVRFPEHARHLDRLKRGRWAGRPPVRQG